MTEGRKKALEDAGINISESLLRLGGNMELVETILEMFPKDNAFINLEEAIKKNNKDDAYRAAHTLKGLTANLSMKELNSLSTQMSDYFKHGKFDVAVSLLPQAREEYVRILKVINEEN